MRQRIPRRSVIRGDVNVAASLDARLDLAPEAGPPGGAVLRKTGRRRVVRPILFVCSDGRRRPLEIKADRSDVRRIRKGLRRPGGSSQGRVRTPALQGRQPVWKSTSASGARQFFTKSCLGDGVAALVPSGGEEPASPRHRACVASVAWRLTRRFSTNAP